MVSKIRKLSRGYAQETRLRFSLKNRLKNVRHQNPIIIYQMGKVGSSSVVRTLEHLKLDVPILHVHTLSSDHLDFAINKQRNSVSPYLHKHLITSSILVKELQKGIFPCRIISLTREPVARAISFLFEDLKKQAPDAILPNKKLDIEILKSTLDQLLSKDSGIADPSQWFENELNHCLGIDVFSAPYDRERGFVYMDHGPVSVLVMRMEDLNRSLLDGLEVLLDSKIDMPELLKANVGNSKWYASSLKLIKETYKLSAPQSQRVFNTKYFQHFYGNQAEQYRERWT